MPECEDSDGDQDAFPLDANPAVNLIQDGCEAASLNNDRVVNSADQLLIALEIAREVDQTLRIVNMDIAVRFVSENHHDMA